MKNAASALLNAYENQGCASNYQIIYFFIILMTIYIYN